MSEPTSTERTEYIEWLQFRADALTEEADIIEDVADYDDYLQHALAKLLRNHVDTINEEIAEEQALLTATASS